MTSPLNLTTSTLASQMRMWRGTSSFHPARKQPEQLLEVYEFEACPYCRLLREALTELELDALIYPCPKNGTRFRPKAIELGAKSQFPLLVDPNTKQTLLESADIIDYLSQTYDGGLRASRGFGRTVSVASSYAATGMRSMGRVRGMFARPSTAPIQPLELYSFESSPYARPVRELLCELELPYILRNFGKSQWREMGPPFVRDKILPSAPLTGRNRIKLRELTGRSQVPYLIDPNTGTAMFESGDIMRYLEEVYAAA